MVNAVVALSQAVKSAPESDRAADLRKQITEKLPPYGRSASGCLAKNRYKHQWHTKYAVGCRKLEEAVADLSFDRIAQDLESDRDPLLVNLCRLALNDYPMVAFERELDNVERPQPNVLSPVQGSAKELSP